MPNIVNDMLYQELERDLRDSGSFLFLNFDAMTVAQDQKIRTVLRDTGVRYRVVKNRLATQAMKDVLGVDIGRTLKGKCGVVFAPEEKAISAAKAVREELKTYKKNVPAPIQVLGGVIEGEPILGASAQTIADMPDRHTVNTQIATAISGPARKMAQMFAALPSGLARCIQQKIDGGDS